jgi:hypothetical protein
LFSNKYYVLIPCWEDLYLKYSIIDQSNPSGKNSLLGASATVAAFAGWAHCPVRTVLSLADRTRVQGKAPPLRGCVALPLRPWALYRTVQYGAEGPRAWMGEACPEAPFDKLRAGPPGESKGLGGGEAVWVSCLNPAYIVRRYGCGGGPASAGIGTPSGMDRKSSQGMMWTSRQT